MDYYVITLHMGYQFVYRKAIYEYSDVGIHRKERKENFLYNLMLKFLEAQSPSSGGDVLTIVIVRQILWSFCINIRISAPP